MRKYILLLLLVLGVLAVADRADAARRWGYRGRRYVRPYVAPRFVAPRYVAPRYVARPAVSVRVGYGPAIYPGYRGFYPGYGAPYRSPYRYGSRSGVYVGGRRFSVGIGF